MEPEDQYLIEHNLIVNWICQRLDSMYETPKMWGSNESIEFQILNYFEMLGLLIYKDFAILNKYRAYIKSITNRDNAWLFNLRESSLIEDLRNFQIKSKLTLLDYENLCAQKIRDKANKTLKPLINEIDQARQNALNLLEKDK